MWVDGRARIYKKGIFFQTITGSEPAQALLGQGFLVVRSALVCKDWIFFKFKCAFRVRGVNIYHVYAQHRCFCCSRCRCCLALRLKLKRIDVLYQVLNPSDYQYFGNL